MAGILVAAGCDAQVDTLTSGLQNDADNQLESDPAVLSKFFTGRDSFGVALSIQSAGTYLVDDETSDCPDVMVTLKGSGNSTHLGLIAGQLSYCAVSGDLTAFSDGEFFFTGMTGGSLSGAFPPPENSGPVIMIRNGDGDVVETKAAVTGGEVSAVKVTPAEGKGDLRIILHDDGSFKQTFDGWLLHHVAGE